jgi:hypothetical protein
VYAVAHALHELLHTSSSAAVTSEAVDGDALMAALLAVQFEGVTGRVDFFHDPYTAAHRTLRTIMDALL